jgi:hypothetical protein
MLVMIFGIRPLFVDRFDVRTMYGLVPDADALDAAMRVGATCLFWFTLGAFIATVRPRRASQILEQGVKAHRRRVQLSAAAVLVVALVSVALYVAAIVVLAGPSSLLALSGGRSSEASLSGVPELVLVVPIAGSVATALFLISRRGDPLRRSEVLLLVVAVSLSLVALSQLGTRRFLIPGLLIPLVAALIRSPVRLKAWHVLAGAAAFIFLAIVPMVRSAGARMPGENLLTASWRYFSDEGIAGVLTPVFASFDTEMLDYIAVYAGQSNPVVGAGKGTFLEFLTRPIPGSGTGLAFSDEVLTTIWGGGCGFPNCPVPSIAGVLYFDGGLVAVAIGSLLFGMFVRFLAGRWALNAVLSDLEATVVAIVSGFALVAARTNTIHAMWWCIYTLLVLFLIHALFSRSPRKAQLGASSDSNYPALGPVLIRSSDV